MKKINFSRLVILGCCIALVTLASVTHTIGQSIKGSTSNPVISIEPVLSISNWMPITRGGSMLARKANGIYMTLNATELTPGTAVTAWVGVFNNPQFCSTTPCTPADAGNPLVQASRINAGGVVVGNDGSVNFGGFRAVGDTRGAEGPGLLNPLTAQVDLVIRSHGPAFSFQFHPALLTQQLTMFNGGCPPNPCQDFGVSTHLP